LLLLEGVERGDCAGGRNYRRIPTLDAALPLL
jgi:hypothetical protein